MIRLVTNEKKTMSLERKRNYFKKWYCIRFSKGKKLKTGDESANWKKTGRESIWKLKSILFFKTK